MNKLLITIGIFFFVIEAISISVFLLDISYETIEEIIPWIIGGSLNIAFLFMLFVGIFRKE